MLYFSFKSRIDRHLYVKILPDGVTLLLRSEPRNLLMIQSGSCLNEINIQCHLSENQGGISWLCHIHCKSEYTLKHCFLLMMVNTTVSVCKKKNLWNKLWLLIFSMHILRLHSLDSINAWKNLGHHSTNSGAAADDFENYKMNLTFECEISWKQCSGIFFWSENYLWFWKTILFQSGFI